MQGSHIAVTVSILLFAIAYFCSLYGVSYYFSKGIVPNFLREKTQPIPFFFLILGITVATPLCSALIFQWGAELEMNNSLIVWKDYIGHAHRGHFFFWFFILKPMVVGFIIGLISPKTMHFMHWIQAVYAFVFHNLYTFVMIYVFDWANTLFIPA